MGNTNTKPLENGQNEEKSATISFTHDSYEQISILQPNPVWLCCKLNITQPPIQWPFTADVQNTSPPLTLAAIMTTYALCNSTLVMTVFELK